MDFFRRFTVLMCAPNFDPDDLEGVRVQQIIGSVEKLGFEVVRARRVEDAAIAVQTDAAIGCMVVDWGKRGLDGKAAALINLMRKRGLEMPIVIMVRRKRLEDIPVEVLDFIDGYIFLAEETPDYIARGLVSRVKQYAETLKTPFFGALVDYAEQGNQLWTCPGHNGGIFYNRSPIGRIFVEHLGEAVFRDDLDNSVLDLGDLLVHEGPALKAQKEAAVIFGAEKTYFVLNGTSASNKIVLSALVAEGDLVLFDRNNHKAAHHGALFLGGAVPVFLETDRNCFGLIGPMYHEALDEAAIREKIRTNPLVTDKEAWKRERPFRVAVVEQCTYDGTIYNAQMILEKIGHLCDYILFDEAWAGFMKFHPLFAGRFAMGLKGLDETSPGIIATQSTHKQLASFSQASQIHTKDSHIRGQTRRIEHRRFNETFLVHASTSPFYPLFASLDVGAQMMKGRSGVVLWDDTIRLGIEWRKKVRAIRREFEEKEGDPLRRWFFDPFVPDTVKGPEGKVPWESVSTDELASDAKYWELTPGAAWHGFTHVAPNYAMTDPNKLTVLTPGFDRRTGQYADHGVPAPIVAQYLRENRIVPEKNDLNSLLFLLTPGVESSKAGTLISGLVAFKRLHDENVPLEDAMPEFVRRRPNRYKGVRLRDLCADFHAFHREHGTSTLQRKQFEPGHLPEMVMTPKEAVQQLTRNNVDYVPIAEAEGRVATTLLLVYPPGIGTVLPGERLDERAKPMLDYFKMFERSANLFPGFEAEIQGVFRNVDPDGTIRFYTYVMRENRP
ncbi:MULTISPECIES: Orn/Lys/Arg decarboxylase N-terminal domain-containing protein [Methylobacterium]|uniref:Inducible ornithine decarboxylase n=1 Tax=Methylobacterium bullatum TaxID=570505 RepID=A0A679JEA3_9HYPH|nr:MULTISPECIES: Orn/Lys/Arg decarboxylase N-terminal domain-containing protein [Methylobacterium]KQO54122.1 amino acid decarboxylase [Methylobacterium sp. Leaf85]KQP38719.1 amino acid decarboxylase [Methylobacterium sp. Leaf106]MBD8904140.1 amino acid decarboxylase [Methylobacterium bullatum]TXN26221.1 amino acid decarboxylase [Methylobacterium sp. WL19]CAA2137114.1 Ornithine decarboxylase, inducible [Methylobacterium bullatum]